jgi:dTDP-glucose 4,6-dehydratase
MNKIPVYGQGLNVRDWIYVKDHCSGIWDVFERGRIGETYCIGTNCEKQNIEIVKIICGCLGLKPKEWIQYVPDRKGHDFRYAIDNTKIKKELGWSPQYNFEDAMAETVRWYYERY